MANYATLKAAIQNVIKTNGNKEITGALLQQSLLAMVNSLGAYYQYAGVANPGDDLGTPDQNVFYFTNGAGSYAGLSIADGEFGIVYYNGTWRLSKLDLLTSIYGKVSAIYDIRQLTFNNGYYWRYDGALGANALWSYSSPIAVTRGTIVYVPFVEATQNIATIVRVDSSNNYISTLKIGADNAGISYFICDFDGYVSVSVLIARQGTEKVFNSSMVDSLIGWVDSLIGDVEKSIDSINKSIEYSEYQLQVSDKVVGYYRVYNDGHLVSSSAYTYTNPIPVIAGDLIVTTRAIDVQTSIAVATYVDENGNALSVLKRGTGQLNKYEIVATQTGYISLSVLTTQIDAFYIIRRPIQRAIAAIASQVSDVSLLQEYIEITTKTVSSSDLITGKYRVSTGSIANNSGYSYTNPIAVHSGDLVCLDNALIVPAVAFITMVDASGNYMKVIKVGESSERQNYRVRITFNGFISLSGLTGDIPHTTILQSSLFGDVLSNVVSLDADSKIPAISSNPLSTILREQGYGAILHKWGIIGDSLSSGEMQCYNQDSQSATDYKFVDMYQWSWGQRFAKMNNVDCYNFSNGGQTTKGWLTRQGVVHDDSYIGGIGGGDWRIAQQNDYLKDGYIIALAVNDRSQTYGVGDVSTDIDDSDYNNNAETYIGYYAGIIQRLKSVQPKCKIFCVTAPQALYDDYNAAIRAIVSHFSALYPGDIYTIDLRLYLPIPDGQTIPTGGLNGGYYLNGHLSPAGYQYMGWVINTYIDWIIRNNGNYFKGAALIGTEYRDEY